MSWLTFGEALAVFAFGYPFVMAFYWMTGGLLIFFLRERFEPPPDAPPPLDHYPPVSILIPCYNEARQAEETFAALAVLDYPDFEIVAINDGSSDGTAGILNDLARRIANMRVVHLATNQGKSTALNTGALAARHEILVCIDGDALLDRHALTWFVRRFQSDGELGALTGNPRIRNRATLLGRLQVGEYSSIVGLIKRAQTVYGRLFTVSGVICAFRKRALQDAGWWEPDTITDDVDVSWRLQLAGWRIAYESRALCWILMPETLKGLWNQRLRWSEGGTRTVLDALPRLCCMKAARLWPIWLNYVASIVWAYTILLLMTLWIVGALGGERFAHLPAFSSHSPWAGTVLALTYLLQAVVSVYVDARCEAGRYRTVFWMVWYPLVFWMLQAITAVVGLPKALLRSRHVRGTWTSPDRGFR